VIDPIQFVADHLGVTREDVAAMTVEEIEALRVSVRAQMDQAEAEASELRRHLEGTQPRPDPRALNTREDTDPHEH
jgi:hypothetical protein